MSAPIRVPFWFLLGAAGLVATNVLVLSGMGTGLRAAVVLPTAVVVPGAIALRVLRLPPREGWDWLLHAVALSLAGLLAVAFAVSRLPGHLLTATGCLLGLDVLIAALAAAEVATGGVTASAARWRSWRRGTVPGLRGRQGMTSAAVAVVLGAAAVGLAIAGARRLNDGGGAGLTEAALAGAVAALVPAAIAAWRGRTTAAATGVYLLGLAVLLATSLRGTGVTGHDIKIEYRVFMETLDRGSWQPGGPFAGYNSCLSITVLPAFLTRLLDVTPLDAFRVCFQLLFAVVPVGVFLIVRRFLPAGYAVLGAGLFVAFPAFVNDLPMLNRQEIALIFFTVAMLTLLRARGTPGRRAALFTVLAVGLTVSHYTSTYVAAGLLGTAWLVRQLRRMPARRAWRAPAAHGVLGLAAVLLVALAVSWAGFAGSASALGGTLRNAAVAVAARAGVYSDSTRYSFVPPVKQATDVEALREYTDYMRQAGSGENAPAPPPGCVVVPAPTDVLTATPGGEVLARVGLPPATLNTLLRRGAVALFEAGALLGCVIAWLRRWRRGRRGRWGRTRRLSGHRGVDVLPELSVAALALLAATVVAPQLSDSYGLLRLYQQLLVVLAPAVLIALVVPLRLAIGPRRTPGPRHIRRGNSRWRQSTVGALVAAVVVGCLLTTSGLVPKLTGGYPPQLNLTNGGSYFRAYYTTGVDLAMMRWVNANVAGHGFVVADARDSANLTAMTPLFPLEGLVPGAIPPDGYLEVSTADGKSATGVAIVGDRAVRYTFPLDCVTGGRALLFAAGPHRLYGPMRP